MRRIILFASLAIISGFTKAQIVNIPDENFKAYLVNNPQINTNSDSEIQVSEAEAFAGIMFCQNMEIADLTGIEAFINLPELDCSHNQLTSLDLSHNPAMKHLYCNNNLLTSVNVSQNNLLENFFCYNNQLTALDVSQKTGLMGFGCSNNQLTSLNIKNGNNAAMWAMGAQDNPSLTCIQVDNAANADSYSHWEKDATANYSENCGVLSTTKNSKKELMLYPNPIKDILNFSDEVSNIRITDASGKIVKQSFVSGKSINISSLAKGSYIITSTTKTGNIITKKIIKE